MRATLWMGSAVAVVALVIAMVAQRSMASASSASSRELHFQEHVTNATYVPIQSLIGSAQASNQADYITFNDPLVESASGRPMGHVMGTCWSADVSASLYYCTVDFVLAHGQITSEGPFDATGRPTTASITGGAGSFRSAEGQVKITSLSPTTNDFVVHLDV